MDNHKEKTITAHQATVNSNKRKGYEAMRKHFFNTLSPGKYQVIDHEKGDGSSDAMDLHGCVDYELINKDVAKKMLISSRVQFGAEPYDSFTIRYNSSYGKPSEWDKLDKMGGTTGGNGIPDELFSFQTYVSYNGDRLLKQSYAPTKHIFQFASKSLAMGDGVVELRTNTGAKGQANQFVVIWHRDLKANNIKVS